MSNRLMTICDKLIESYGIDAQTDKFIEECGEATVALLHHRLGRGNRQNLIKELSDVHFTLAQMLIIYDEDNEFGEVLNKIIEDKENELSMTTINVTREEGETFDEMIARSDIEIERLEKGGNVIVNVNIPDESTVIITI